MTLLLLLLLSPHLERALPDQPAAVYTPLLGHGDADAAKLVAVARYGLYTLKPGQSTQPESFNAEEQIGYVLDGAGTLDRAGQWSPLKSGDFFYLPPATTRAFTNTGRAELRILIAGYKLPPGAKTGAFEIANSNDVPLQVLASHGPTTQFKLLMGQTTSKRDRISAASEMSSLFLMDFAPGGTNIPHSHAKEEEIYLLLRGSGELVAGDQRIPVKAGAVFFYPPGTKVGYYSGAKEGQPHDQILAIRSRLPEASAATIENLRLESGAVVPACRVAYKTYGTLNADRSNAVLFPTWFTGRKENLEGFIGPGKLVDPARFYVITVDALANGASCSPPSKVTIGDMVESQYRLLTEHLNIKRLHAVMGISMGGMQTFEWITSHPDFMRLAVPIIGSPRLTQSDTLLWQAELGALEAGATAAVRAMHQFALRTPAWLEANPLPPAEPDSLTPADYAAQLRAMLAHDVTRKFNGSLEDAAAAVRAKVLVVVATQDHMVNPAPALRMAARAGFNTLKLTGDCGHMATACEAGKMNEAVARFLMQ